MRRWFSILALAGIAVFLGAPFARAEELTAEDYIRYWEPNMGSWDLSGEEGGKSLSGTLSFQLSPTKTCILTYHTGLGIPPTQRIDGYDPATKKWTMAAFNADGGSSVATLDIANMKKGKVLAEGLLGKWEYKQSDKNGQLNTGSATFSCKKLTKNQLTVVWTDRKDNEKALPDLTLILKRQGTGSDVAARTQPQSAAEHLKPMEWMIGDWIGEYTAPADLDEVKQGDRVTVAGSVRWMLDRRFIVSDFYWEVQGKKVLESREIFGWDYAAKRVGHWFFGNSGTGEGVWTLTADRGQLQWSVNTPDGKLTGTGVVEKQGIDSYLWQLKNLASGEKKLPDWPLVTLKRKMAADDLWKAYRDVAAGTWTGTGALLKDRKEDNLSRGDQFQARFSLEPEMDGAALVGHSEFRVADRPKKWQNRVLVGRNPATRQVCFHALWNDGGMEEIILSEHRGTTFLGTYSAGIPGQESLQARVKMDYTDANTCVLTFLDGPFQGEQLSSWRREK
jgi:hypothetical protein